MKRVRLRPEAVAELAKAAAWYEQRRAGLGRALEGEVEAALPALGQDPSRFPRLGDVPRELAVRRMLLPRFPYALVFMELAEEVRVLAVAHVRRRPGYWLGRVSP